MAEQRKINGSLALNTASRVITIPAAEQEGPQRLRVAAYCRVSSDSADQLNSFAAQNAYYTALITRNPDWELVDIYADRGISGTSADKREDFQRLLADCKRGRIDKILVKSISRFARNTKDCLKATRELKEIGVGVCFEEQNIDSSRVSGEMMTAIFAALAQKESESISQNMRMSYKRRMERGEFLTCKAPFGYRLVDGQLIIEESEASIIRLIFKRYLAGKCLEEIAEEITTYGFPTRDGHSRWQRKTIRYILQNERYAGDTLLQKRFTTDTLPYRQKWNTGEKAKYFIPESHPAIVSKDDFETAQALLQRKSERVMTYPTKCHDFRLRIVCGECGTFFKRKETHGSIYWICRTHFESKSRCLIKQIPEKEFQSAFLRMYYKLRHQGRPVLEQLLSDLQTAHSRRLLWSLDIVELNNQIAELTRQERLLAMLKKHGGVDPDIFISQSGKLAEQLRAAKQAKSRLMDAEEDQTITQTQELLDILDDGPEFLEVFDGELFGELVDKIIVESNECLRFRLINRLELTETIERTVR
ncbi:recombinase family protein [uncultured Oscillibacter sp.]|uniref:recombinase family protein n=1 Tax=uncultured Oscillibacter sp. TaxID=876091 RepID=UPI00263421E3|nr:recombinase family protein [uncultured Oscillibacter sp.]